MSAAPAEPNGPTQRVFVALWPPPGTRDRLESLGARLHAQAPRARRVRGDRLHLTLAFIGALETPRVTELARRLSWLAVRGFEWTLDRTGYFARARVVWAGGPTPEPLAALIAEVRALLEAMTITYDHKPFVPHVTLLRDVNTWQPGMVPIRPPIPWHCDRPVLVGSALDGSYVVIKPSERPAG
jgi:2'-5' RNA ligase